MKKKFFENVKCENSNHPNGAWHKASPMPMSNEWWKRFKWWWRKTRYGCGCEVDK